MAAPGVPETQMRVALIGCTGLLGNIIGETLAGEPRVNVVADLEPPARDAELPTFDADLVLWNNADESRVERWMGRISDQGGLRVLTTTSDGRDASLWELTPHRTELGALSPTSLLETILGLSTRMKGGLP